MRVWSYTLINLKRGASRKRRKHMELEVLKYIAAGIGAGLTVIGAGLGLGKIGNAALEGTARQPEAANAVRTTMIIIAALLEGAAMLGLVICLLTMVM